MSSQPNPARARQNHKVPEHIRPDAPEGGKPHEHEEQDNDDITHEPVVNPQARTHPLAGPGARWKGVPLEEDYQRALDENEERGLRIGESDAHSDLNVALAPETAPEKMMKDEKQAQRKTGALIQKVKKAFGGRNTDDDDSSDDDRNRTNSGTKRKGHIKVAAGKVKRNEAMVAEGKQLKRGGSEWE